MATLPTLPTDIIAEILLRLPPKPLGRFKCVAKNWNSLISSHDFIKQHLKQTLISHSYPNLLIRHDSLSVAEFRLTDPKSVDFYDLDHPVIHLPDYSGVELLGSCNGVVCMSDYYKETVFFYNPETKTHRLIPPVPSNIPDRYDPLVSKFTSNVIKPVDFIVCFGFGYDSGSDDYKLLRVLECYVDRVHAAREVRLYSLRSDCWKCVDDDLICYPNQPFNAVNVDGVLYFLVTDESRVGSVAMIKWFDLQTERFGLLELFEYKKGSFNYFFVLKDLGGCFCVLVNYLNQSYCMPFGRKLRQGELWVLKERCKKESWVRLFSICDPERIGSMASIRPVFYSIDETRILLELDGRNYCWYDWCKNKVERVEARGLPGDEPFDTSTFVGSLVSLKSDKEMEKDEKKEKETATPKKNTKMKTSDGFLFTGVKLKL